MRALFHALLMAFLARPLAALEPEAQRALLHLQRRILADLNLKKVPDVAAANVSESERRRVTARYWRNVRRTNSGEHRLLSYEARGSSMNGKMEWIFKPDVSAGWSIKWARLWLPERVDEESVYRLIDGNFTRQIRSSIGTYLDVSKEVRDWTLSQRQGDFRLAVQCDKCVPNNARLKVRLTEDRERLKRSASRLDCSRGFDTKLCCRHSLRVSFKDIGWDWIVQPEEFEAFYCKGRCRDVSDNFASTHALIQSLLNYKDRHVARSCCAPRKLRPLDLLHYNDKDPPELVVTRQKGMIVKECACT